MIAVKNEPKVTVFSGKANLDKQIEKDEAELRALIEQAMFQNEEEIETIEIDVSDAEDAPREEPKKVETVEDETPPKKAANESGDVYEKRYKDAQRYINKLKDQIKELEAKKAEPVDVAPPKSKEELEAWMKKYPDVAGFIKSLAIEQYASTKTEIQELKRLQEELKLTKAEQALMQIHPDYQDIRDSDDFHTWASEQPQWVQQSLYENVEDVKSVARIIDLYKVEAGKVSRRDPDEMDAAKTVKSKRSVTTAKGDPEGPLFTESQVARMSDAEYAANEDKINEAIRLGRFKYDISLRRA